MRLQHREVLEVLAESTHFHYSRGMILSGPFLEVISVNSRNILAAFLASDFRLEGIGLFTVNTKEIKSDIYGRFRMAHIKSVICMRKVIFYK